MVVVVEAELREGNFAATISSLVGKSSFCQGIDLWIKRQTPPPGLGLSFLKTS